MNISVIRIKTNGRACETGPLMREMVNRYFLDMAPFAHYSLIEIFDFVKNIPYREDPPNEETLMRPYFTIHGHGWGGDCDDKAIVIASWAKLVLPPDPQTGRSYRFIAVRRADSDSLHHVYPEVFYKGEYIICDATYNFNRIGRLRENYAEYVII
jgi:hypothetical protein